MRPLKIALGDLSYIRDDNAHNLYVPLNIGYLAAYAKKRFGRDVQVDLFKDPKAMLQHCRTERPELVGLSAYYWNDQVGKLLARKVRAEYDPVIALGGPSIDTNVGAQADFRVKHPHANVVIPNEGEDGFVAVVEAMLSGDWDVETPPLVGLSTDLGEVPSPYLDGTLDPFLTGPYQPMIQTSRLCPYTCLAGDTKINTIIGDIPIRELADRYGDAGIPVYTYDPETREAFISDAVMVRRYGQDKPLVRVHFDDGTHIDCTPDHRFLQFSRNKQWECEASDLPAWASVRAIRTEINEVHQRAYMTWGRRGRRLRSRMIMDHIVGRRLGRKEHVHHIDHDTLNDAPDNLAHYPSAAEHLRHHLEIAERMRINNPAKNGLSQEWRDNLGAANRGKVRSLESRRRYRESKMGDKNPNFKGGAHAGRSRIPEVNHRVVNVEHLVEKGDVYCLTVPATGWFFANNVLVKNCSFCVSGKNRGKLRAFGLDQVREELLYIGKRFNDRQDHRLYITDENFGILDRDLQVAEYILKAQADTGYPSKIFYYNDKRFTSLSRQLQERVGHMCYHGVTLSLQSENPETLKAIKRRNLTDVEVASAIEWAHNLGLKTSTELIFGLPMETRASFLGLLDKCARVGFDAINCYNLIIFDGIEMNREEYRAEHKLTTKRRLISGSSMVLDGELVVESEEVVVSSGSFSFDDYRLIRSLNVLFHAIFINDVHREMIKGLVDNGVSLTEFLTRFLTPSDSEDHRAFLSDLAQAIAGELYTDAELATLISDAEQGLRPIPDEIKIQPIFAARLRDHRDGWVGSVLGDLAPSPSG